MKTHIHLFDGTFELFRLFYGSPKRTTTDGREVGATRTFLNSFYNLLLLGKVTHIGIAFDYVIESFRNQLFSGYKTGFGIDPDLYSQFRLVEEATEALGIVCWPMVEFEADDAIATASVLYGNSENVDKIVICSPDKDFAQCVKGNKVIMWDRIRDKYYNEEGVWEKWGVAPQSIPDLLALIGDKADGVPGIPRWGSKSASTLLAKYGSIENIPDQEDSWSVKVRGAKGLAEIFRDNRNVLKLYKTLTILRTDVPIKESVTDLEWKGINKEKLEILCNKLEFTKFLNKVS